MQRLLLTISILSYNGKMYAYAPAIAQFTMPIEISSAEDAELVIRDFLSQHPDSVINPIPPISAIHQTKLWLRLHGHSLSDFITYITIVI